jgi:hypothetical protein
MFVSDNASNNDTLASNLARKLEGQGLFKGTKHRVRCFAHILNLVMKVSAFYLILGVPYSTPIPEAFLHVFLRKEKGKKSSGGDDEWRELADAVDKYTTMVSDDRDVNSDDANSDDDNDMVPVDTQLDSEREEMDELAIDECEAECDDPYKTADLEEDDLVLNPISVSECREACVLLSKVRVIILLQGPH